MNPFSYTRLLFLLSLLSLSSEARAAERWQRYENCQLVANEANDGDSFHVRADGHEYIFRLYFVDTPETSNDFPARVAAQAKYFHLTVPQTLQVGLEAERYTRQQLSRPFTVITRKQDARGQSRLPRYFAIVETGNEGLAEQLVAKGLARVHGIAARAPGVSAPAVEKRRLLQLESKARSGKLGGWGLAAARVGEGARVVARAAPGSKEDSFDAFFHPKTPSTQAASPPAQTSAPVEKLDVNTASAEALKNLPGIGVVIANRIIAARPFKSADELQSVSGVGPRKYEQLRPYFR
jgi:competence protein ComEA